MAYEYSAQINSTKSITLEELLDSNLLRECVTFVKAEPKEVFFNWIASPTRTANAPDVSVVRDENGMYVAFHAATSSQRESLLQELREQATRKFQLDLAFEEI